VIKECDVPLSLSPPKKLLVLLREKRSVDKPAKRKNKRANKGMVLFPTSILPSLIVPIIPKIEVKPKKVNKITILLASKGILRLVMQKKGRRNINI